MRITLKQLKKMNVETISGKKLGKVSDVVLQTDGQVVEQYEVKTFLLPGKTLLIGRSQIVRFEKERLIVDDEVDVAEKEDSDGVVGTNPEPITMREIGN
jgi:sporulation protein YlmC with PRC-barrel domain